MARTRAYSSNFMRGLRQFFGASPARGYGRGVRRASYGRSTGVRYRRPMGGGFGARGRTPQSNILRNLLWGAGAAYMGRRFMSRRRAG